MLDREQIANWDSPPSYAVTDEGMIVNKDGKAVLTVSPDTFPDLIVRMATVLRGRRGPMPGY